jgi:hypothetical protein
MVHARARLLNLRKQHGWGDISDAGYRTQVEETRRMLAEVPDHHKRVLFGQNRRALTTVPKSWTDSIGLTRPPSCG